MSRPLLVVTGANGRLGFHCCRSLRDDYRLAPVVRTSERIEPLRVELDRDGPVYAADVTDSAAVSSCFRRIADEQGTIYGLIHTVGAWAETPVRDGDPATWAAMVEVNLTSAYLVMRAALRRMERRGRLIAFTSRQGADGGVGGQSAYSAAKAGVLRLVESAAEETPEELTVHAVAPSFIRFEDESADGVDPERIVAACRFLLGEDGLAFDGQVLRAYGSSR